MTIFVVMTDTTAAGTESHPFQFGIQSPLQAVMVGKVDGVAGVATGFGQNLHSSYNVSSNGFSNIIESFRYTAGDHR